MACSGCGSWQTLRKTVYGDGTEIINWQTAPGVGKCQALNIETEGDFHCAKFVAGDDHIDIIRKNGGPWLYWHMGPCPRCDGNPAEHGASMCQCAGTGIVRYYEDGFVGEEHTRLHPKEKEMAEPPKCGKCRRNIDINWVACPYCGNALEAMAEPVSLGEGNAGVVGRM